MEQLFSAEVYVNRRKSLMRNIEDGIVLFIGNSDSAINYSGNIYHFRQDSTFLYFFGLDSPDLAAIIDTGDGSVTLFGNDPTIEDFIWTGETEILANRALKVGVKLTAKFSSINAVIKKALGLKRTIHYLPPYRHERKHLLAELFHMSINRVNFLVSHKLIQAVSKMRLIKEDEEILEIENTLTNVTLNAFILAIQQCSPGLSESYIAGLMEGYFLQQNCRTAYPIICTTHGEILHNHSSQNSLEAGQLLLIDAGAESPKHYATDITRTLPVNGKFTTQQSEIYNLVLTAIMASQTIIRPETTYADVHLKAATTIADGLVSLGIMKGNPAEIAESGAHALFFPHGLGHQLGLDVHDMEDFGEDNIGYDNDIKRSKQFGTAYLRYAKKLTENMVITLEPGIYFIPVLIQQWKKERKFENFINYSVLEKYENFGGIRIEDNLLIMPKGYRVLGSPIPKEISEIEELCGKK